MMCAPFISFSICFWMLAPPYTHTMRTSGLKVGQVFEILGDLLGQLARGGQHDACGYTLSCSSPRISGMPNAQVLPVARGGLGDDVAPFEHHGMAFFLHLRHLHKAMRSTALCSCSGMFSSLYSMSF